MRPLDGIEPAAPGAGPGPGSTAPGAPRGDGDTGVSSPHPTNKVAARRAVRARIDFSIGLLRVELAAGYPTHRQPAGSKRSVGARHAAQAAEMHRALDLAEGRVSPACPRRENRQAGVKVSMRGADTTTAGVCFAASERASGGEVGGRAEGGRPANCRIVRARDARPACEALPMRATEQLEGRSPAAESTGPMTAAEHLTPAGGESSSWRMTHCLQEFVKPLIHDAGVLHAYSRCSFRVPPRFFVPHLDKGVESGRVQAAGSAAGRRVPVFPARGVSSRRGAAYPIMAPCRSPSTSRSSAAGFITRVHSGHLRRIRDEIVPSYATRDRARAEAYGVCHGGRRSYARYREAIEDLGVGAVVVAVPARFHLDLTLRALAAGKHVLVEKPAFPRLADYEQVRDARDRAGREALGRAGRRHRDDRQVLAAAPSAAAHRGLDGLVRPAAARLRPGRRVADRRAQRPVGSASSRSSSASSHGPAGASPAASVSASARVSAPARRAPCRRPPGRGRSRSGPRAARSRPSRAGC